MNTTLMPTFFQTLLLKLWRVLPFPLHLRWMLVWPLQRKFLVGVAAIVLNQESQILLLYHNYRPEYSWGLPSGWLERGEQPAEAILREIREETGLLARVVQLLSVQTDPFWPRLDIIFLCCLEGGQFIPSPEVSQARFFDLQALPDLLASQQKIIRNAVELLAPERSSPPAVGRTQTRL